MHAGNVGGFCEIVRFVNILQELFTWIAPVMLKKIMKILSMHIAYGPNSQNFHVATISCSTVFFNQFHCWCILFYKLMITVKLLPECVHTNEVLWNLVKKMMWASKLWIITLKREKTLIILPKTVFEIGGLSILQRRCL